MNFCHLKIKSEYSLLSSLLDIDKIEDFAKNIKKSNIKAITDGKDTLESFQLIRNEFPDLKTVTLISDPAHLWRSKLMAENLGFEAKISGTQDGPGSLLSNSYFVREVASTLRYEFKSHFSRQWSLLRSIVL